MKRAPARKPPVFITRSHVEAGPHYASHVDQPIQRIPMRWLPDDAFDALINGRHGHDARGIPEVYNYAHGVIRVWPWPAEGWQVWTEVANKDVTP